MKIYAISGLGADERVFRHLHVNADIIPIKWVDPDSTDSLESYSNKLLDQVDPSAPFALMGVSFGGMVAVELSKKLNPNFTILISSAENRNDFRWIYRLIGRSKVLRILPKSFFQLPKNLIRILFNAKNSKLLYQILNDTDPAFVKWCLTAMVEWKNKDGIANCHRIMGEKDILLPHSKNINTSVIKKGHHFMIVDKAREISAEINRILEKHKTS